LQVEIVPNDSVLQAELFVPTRAIGLVQPGHEVRILYEAFPYQQFGTYSGKVSRDNLDENGGGNQGLKRRPVARS
jgi:membrane fusion protein